MEWDRSGDRLVGVCGWHVAEVVDRYGRYEWALHVINNWPFITGIAFSEEEARSMVEQALMQDTMVYRDITW
jgi:hypothetical protein